MKCEIAKSLLMDFLYEEMDPEAQAQFEKHLEQCGHCREELSELQKTRQMLQVLPEEAPESRLVFSALPRRSFAAWWKDFVSLLPRPVWARAALATATIALLFLVVGSLANLQIIYNNNRFQMSMHLFSPKPGPISGEVANALLAQMRAETSQMVAQMHATVQQEQQEILSQTLSAVARNIEDLERKRESDLMLIGQGLQEIHRTATYQFGETNQVLQQLVRHISLQRK